MIDQVWSALAVTTCVAKGIDHFFLAPGSRCTPLTLAVANHNDAHVTQHFDERGLAFAALGYARATDRAGVFICTSGTAVANAFPAVIEACMECVPMLLLTADRPPELHGIGANQAIDQQKIFGEYVRCFIDLPCPTEEIAQGFVRSQIEHAIASSQHGPVHLNWMFREPFGLSSLPRSAFLTEGQVSPAVAAGKPRVDPIRCDGDTVVIVGGCRPEEAATACEMAVQLNAPLLTDITSGIRGISPDVPAKFDLPRPKNVVHIGGRIVSKAWLNYVATLSPGSTKFWHFTRHDVRIDPNHRGIDRIVAPLQATAARLAVCKSTSDAFRGAWEEADRFRRMAISRVIADCGNQLSEPAISIAIGCQMPSGHGLFLGNSMPVRDSDWFSHWPQAEKQIHVAANRGASGIDGLIATAVGFAIGRQQATTLVIGDLSALHDLNSLALVAKSPVPLIVVIVNNHAGHIFDMLPVSQASDHFEQYFATPHAFGFAGAAEMFGLNHRLVQTCDDFKQAYQAALETSASVVIEAITDRKYNQDVRKRIADEIVK